MNKRDLTLFFLLEVGAILWAAFVFSVLSNRLLAGALAGLYFIFMGFFIIIRARSWPAFKTSLIFYCALVHVFAISLPLQVMRFLQSDLAFEDVRIAGFSGPQFHQFSTTVFSCLMLATVVDWLRVWRSQRKLA